MYLSVGQSDVLRVEVLLDALGAALTAEAGFLDATERGRRVGDDAAVDADHPGFDALGHPQRPVQGLRVDVGREAVLGVVGRGVISDAAAPFGGIKESGFGREGGTEGIEEYLDTKYIALTN